jgi:hypothetical protein
MKALSAIVAIALCLAAATPVHAGDDDLIYDRIGLAMVTTHSAVASEGSGATDHAQRVVVVRNWVTSPGTWAPRAVEFVKTQDATQLDTCTGDGVSGIPAHACSANGTQAAVDNLMSAYLSVLVAAGHGG